MNDKPPTSAIIGASVAVAGLGYSVYNAEKQKSKANQIEKGLKDPVYNIPSEFYQNREIARQMAEQGLPQEVINNQTNRINQNQAQAIDAISKGNNPTGAASIVRQGDAAGDTLAAEDAQARQNNQRYFIEQNKQVAGQELAKQQSDVFDKYTRDFNQAQAYRGAGMQNENTAVQDATQLGMVGLQYAGQRGTTTPTDPTLAPGTAQQMQLPPWMQKQYGLPNQPTVPYGTNWTLQ